LIFETANRKACDLLRVPLKPEFVMLTNKEPLLSCLRCHIPLDLSLPFGAVFSDPAWVGFSERAPETSSVRIVAVSWRSWLLPPGLVQITTVDRVEAEIIDETKYCGLGIRRIAEDRKSDPPLRSSRNPFLKKARGEDVVERLDHGTPDLLRYPLAVEHATVDRIDASIAKLRMVVADIDDDDAARHVRKQPSRKLGDRLRWDRKDDDSSGFGDVDNPSRRRADIGPANVVRLSGPL
jgi:hypothetical protein